MSSQHSKSISLTKVATWLSVMLLLASLAWWVVVYIYPPGRTPGIRARLILRRTDPSIQLFAYESGTTELLVSRVVESPGPPSRRAIGGLGFAVVRATIGGVQVHGISAPLWFPPLLFALFPTLMLARRYRGERHVRPEGCCVCGYNMTGNVSGVCPECGRGRPS